MNEAMALSAAGMASTVLALTFDDVSTRGLFAAVSIMLFIASVLAWVMSGDREP